jgi:hypothetical protein
MANVTSPAELSFFSGIWPVLPSILWISLILFAILLFKKEIQQILHHFSWRLRTGAALKLFSIELGQSYVSPSADLIKDESALDSYVDKNNERKLQRQMYYQPNRNIQLVHRIAPSENPGMLYDIHLYLITHKDGTLCNVAKVEYYFGPHWGNLIFISVDRGRGFPISTSAFGTFICTAKLYFTDHDEAFVSRYVDFEMGAIGNKK